MHLFGFVDFVFVAYIWQWQAEYYHYFHYELTIAGPLVDAIIRDVIDHISN